MSAAAWVERNTRRDLSNNHIRCIEVLCTIAAPYNLPLIGDGWQGAVDEGEPGAREAWEVEPVALAPVVFHPDYIIARLHAELATFDGSELTRLVVAAHEKAVRVALRPARFLEVDTDGCISEWRRDPGVPGTGRWVETDERPTAPAACLEIQLSPRSRAGSLFERHPTLAQALDPEDGER